MDLDIWKLHRVYPHFVSDAAKPEFIIYQAIHICTFGLLVAHIV